MSAEELEELEKRAKFSGWDRGEGAKIILKLIAEIRKRPYIIPCVR